MPVPPAGPPARIVLQVLPMATLPLAVQVMLRNLSGRRAFRFTGSPQCVRQFAELPSEVRARHDLLHGHVHFGIDSLLPEPALYLTMLRDPIENAAALYYLVLSTPGHYLQPLVAGRTLDEFLEAKRPEIDNPMVRWLNPPMALSRFGDVTPSMLEAAKDNLRERYVFGLAERFDESLLLMARGLGWADARYAALGAPPEVRLGDSLPVPTYERIREINRYDVELYQYASWLFEGRWREAFASPEGALHTFRESNRPRVGTITMGGMEIELAPPPEEASPARDIVWLASYPRSGNTWLRFLLDTYFFGPAQHLNELGRLSMELDWWLSHAQQHGMPVSWIHYAGRTHQRRHVRRAELPDHLFIKTHFPRTADHPLIDRTRAAVYVMRDPRDVLLSGLNFSELSTGETADPRQYALGFIDRGGPEAWHGMGYSSWQDHVESWLEGADFPVLSVRYEALRAAPETEFARVLEFLGVPVDPARVKQTVASTSFERLRMLEVASRATSEIPGMVRKDRYFFHRGLSGQSLAELGPEVERRFLERFGPALARHGYT